MKNSSLKNLWSMSRYCLLLNLMLFVAGCNATVREKTKDPQEVEQHRQQHIQQMQQEFSPSS